VILKLSTHQNTQGTSEIQDSKTQLKKSDTSQPRPSQTTPQFTQYTKIVVHTHIISSNIDDENSDKKTNPNIRS
jgi:hypothetical protein